MDYVLYIAGFLISIVPLLREIKKSDGKLPILYVTFLIISGVIVLILGSIKICSDNKKERIYISKIENLSGKSDILGNTILKLKDTLMKNSKAEIQFKKLLLEKFKIRDSSNIPVKTIQIFNTHINKAQTVNIGND